MIESGADLLTSVGSSDEQLAARFSNLAAPMLKYSKYPDLVVNRGHYFGTAEFNDQEGLTRTSSLSARNPN